MSPDLRTRLANALDALSAYVRHEPLCKAGLYPGIGTCSCGLTPELDNKRDLVAALEASAGAGWQPIETAPPTAGNGLHVLAYVPRYGMRSLVVEAWVNDAHPGSPWVAENGGQIEPTHWMPLPPQPAKEAR